MVTLSGAGHKVTLEAHTKRVAHEGSPIALPTPLLQDDVPGIGDFTIVIGDHQDDGNPIIEA